MSEYRERVQQIRSDPEQWMAFERPFAENKSCVIIAGPGSGKTYLLTTTVARLLYEKVPVPLGVACITYSNFLTRQLESDLRKLGVFGNPRLFVGTVHSFCLAEIIHPYKHLFPEVGELVPEPFRIASREQRQESLRQALLNQGCTENYLNGLKENDWRKIFQCFDKYRRQNLEDPVQERLLPGFRNTLCKDWRKVKWEELADDYSQNLLTGEHPATDFVEIELLALRIVQRYLFVRSILVARYPWLVIDEYQDLGNPFHQMVNCLMAQTTVRIFAIGDPDQCIYEDIAGTRPEHIRELAERIQMHEQSESITLLHNYRCKQSLIDISERILGEPRGYKAIEEGGVCEFYECVNEDQQQLLLLRRILPQLHLSPDWNPEDVAILHPLRAGGVNIISGKLDKFEEQWPHRLDRDIDYDGRHSRLISWLEQMAQWCLGSWRSGSPYFRDLLPLWIELNTDPKSHIQKELHHNLQMLLFNTLWDLRQQTDPQADPLMFREWFTAVNTNLELQSLLSAYEQTAPDDVEEFSRLVQSLTTEGRLSQWTLARFAKGEDRIQLTTFHSSKGTQFKIVVIMGLDKVLSPRRQLAYVAITRAKERALVLYTKQPSFLSELRKNPIAGCVFEKCN